PEPTPPPSPTCIAPSDYPCPCPLQARYDRETFKLCMASGGTLGGSPGGGLKTAYYAKKQRKPVVFPPAVSRPQGQNACMIGGLVMLLQLPEICRKASLECVPFGQGGE